MRELILNFHGVGKLPVAVDNAEAAVWWGEVPFLRALDEIAAAAQNLECPISITFDDGNASDLSIALPALVERGLNATFFICAGRVGMVHYLDAVAIADLLQSGMAVGSHGMNHVDWRRTNDRELDTEIVGARKRLEDICGQRIDDVAIPFGSYDRRVIKRLKCEGWRCVYSSDGGFARAGAWFKPRQTLGKVWEQDSIVPKIRASDTLLMASWRRLSVLRKLYR